MSDRPRHPKTAADSRRRQRWAAALLALSCMLVSPPAIAAAKQKEYPFRGALYEAELVMTHQEKIGLSKGQRDEIVLALQRMQSGVIPPQLELAASGERLLKMLEPRRVDLDAALDEAAEAMRLENLVKLEHIRLLVEIKNLLTAEQQSQLDRIREGE